MPKNLWALVLFCLPTSVFAAGDMTPDMVWETRARIVDQALVEIPYLSQVLERVPIYKATAEFLNKYGSGMGIYYKKAIYLNESLFDGGGVLIQGASFGVLAHEAWHAYYDLLMPKADRRALEDAWASYYSKAGYRRYDAIWIGDEAVGSYAQALASLYLALAQRYVQQKKITASILNLYSRTHDGDQIYGYDDKGEMAKLPLSGPGRLALLRASAGAFPAGAALLEVLEKRAKAQVSTFLIY